LVSGWLWLVIKITIPFISNVGTNQHRMLDTAQNKIIIII